MTGPITKLRTWARANKDRSFEIRYVGADVKHPFAIDLENNATQATVHADGFAKLREAVDWALGKAAKEEAL